ncbi:MAG: LptF/LptG family permease [Planctomycetota bacterium]|nr:LptF/LptG family permease [Planctomycetota bacterium]
MKFFLPPLIRRTVRARFLGNFVLLFGLLFLLATSIDTLLTFHEYLEVTSGEGIQRFIQAFGFVIDFQLPRLFQLYALLWSPAVVGAAGFTFVRMQRHREIVGLQAAGISRRSLMRPIVEGTLILIVLQGLNQEFMVPKLSPLLARTHGDIGQDAIRAFAVPPTPDGSGRLWCSVSCDPVRGSMADVLVLERDETGRTVRRIEAATATWDENGLWQLTEGSAIDLAELPRPPQPVASLTTDLDPMVLLARHRSQFASLFGWTDISRTLKRLESGGDEVNSVEDRFRRQYSAHFSALLAGILLPFLALPALLGPRPDGLIRAGTRAVALGLGGFVLTWGSMLADIPGFSPEIAPYLPTLLLCPLAIGAWLSIRG